MRDARGAPSTRTITFSCRDHESSVQFVRARPHVDARRAPRTCGASGRGRRPRRASRPASASIASGVDSGGGGTGIGPGMVDVEERAAPRRRAAARPAAPPATSASGRALHADVVEREVEGRAGACDESATSRATSPGAWPPSVSVVSSTATRARRRRRAWLPCRRASAPGSARAPRRESTSPSVGCGGTSSCAAATPKRLASTEPSALTFISPNPGSPSIRRRRSVAVRGLGPHPRRVAAVLLGDDRARAPARAWPCCRGSGAPRASRGTRRRAVPAPWPRSPPRRGRRAAAAA